MPKHKDIIFLQDLEIECLIGIFAWERRIRQKVTIDLEFPADVRKAARYDRIEDALDYKKIAKRVIDFASKSRFYLIETLAEKIAALILQEFHLSEIKVRVAKPGAIRCAKNVGVEILRRRK